MPIDDLPPAELARRLAFARAANRMAETIMASDDADAVLDGMARIVGETLELDRTLIYDVDWARDEAVGLCEWLNPRVAVTATKATYPLAAFRSTADAIRATHAPHASHASAPSASLVADGAAGLLHEQMAIRSLYWHPFAFRDGGLHLLAFNQVQHERRFDDAELEFVRTVGEYVSLALMKIRLTADLRRSSDALRASEERYRAVSENAPSMVITASRDATILSANRTAVEHLGYAGDALVGRAFAEIVLPDDRGVFDRWLAASFAAPGQAARAEMRIRHADGTASIETASARVARGHAGSDIAFWIFDDVTAQRQAEQAVLEAQKLESIGLLASGIAHDFNNLLVGVLGAADVGLAMVPPDSALRPILEQILLAGRHAADLAGQLLAYAGRAQPRVDSVDVRAVFQEMAGLLRSTLPKGVTLDVELEPGPVDIAGDASQIRQILMNLVVNAGEAARADGGRIAVRAAVSSADAVRGRFPGADLAAAEYVALSIEDDGVGMDDETLRRMFEPFFSTKRVGRGLGLAAVRGIVEAHRGAIRARSTIGHGTAVELVMPRAEGSAVARAPGAVEATPARPLLMQRVLVVDDDAVVRFIVELMLRQLGVEAKVVADTQSARALLADRSERIDALLLDVTMPEGGGAAVLRAVVDKRPGLPVVLMSGYSEREASAAVISPVAGFLQKPFTVDQLRGGLSEAAAASTSAAHDTPRGEPVGTGG